MIQFFIYFGYFLLGVNTLFLLIGFKKNDTPFKMFCLYSISMSIVQFISWYLAHNHTRNIFMSHFYFWLQFFTLSLFFYYLIKSAKTKKIIQINTVVISLIGVISYLLYPEQLNTYSYVEIIGTTFSLVAYALVHLYNLLSQEKKYYTITVGLILYLFGSTIVFLTGNLFLSFPKGYYTKIQFLNISLYVVYQGFILYELVTMMLKKKKV